MWQLSNSWPNQFQNNLTWPFQHSWNRVPSRGGFGGLNPHQNHLDPHFIWPWVQWTLCIDLSQAGSNFSYGILKSLVCWWPHSSFVLYNVIRKYNICSRIKCQHVTCAQYDHASTPERVNLLLQMKTNLSNCCFGLNKNDDFDNYESTISGEPYMWRNQDDHWDVTLDFNLCGTSPWTDIHHQLFIYLFYLFYLNHYLNHWWVIVTGELLQFSSQALTLQIFNILWNVKSDA